MKLCRAARSTAARGAAASRQPAMQRVAKLGVGVSPASRTVLGLKYVRYKCL